VYKYICVYTYQLLLLDPHWPLRSVRCDASVSSLLRVYLYVDVDARRTPRPCSVCGSPRLCRRRERRRRERRLIEARFGRWREDRFGRARCLTVRAEHICVYLSTGSSFRRLPKRVSRTANGAASAPRATYISVYLSMYLSISICVSLSTGSWRLLHVAYASIAIPLYIYISICVSLLTGSSLRCL